MARTKKLAAVEAEIVKAGPPDLQADENGEEVAIQDDSPEVEVEGDFLPIPENLQDLLDQANKPPLPEGVYLAALIKVEGNLNPTTKAYGYWWTWLINSGNYEDGWDSEAKVLERRQYTYVGKLINGKIESTSGGFSATNVLGSLDVTGSLNTEKVRGRQVIVQIKHRKDQNDDSITYMDVSRTIPYIKDGVKAPVLNFVKDAAPVVAKKQEKVTADW